MIPATVASLVSRKFQFNYAVPVPPMKAPEGKLLLWLPLPQDDKYQKIEDLHIDSSVESRQGHDPPTTIPTLNLRQPLRSLKVVLMPKSNLPPLEHMVDWSSVKSVSAHVSTTKDPSLERYLEPDKLVPLNGVIVDLVKQHTAGDTTELAEAKHIYDYVVATMR